MSLIRPVLRATVVQALKFANTWAGDRVMDSDNTPLAELLAQDQQKALPFMTVYTDMDTRINIQGHSVYMAQRQLRLIVEIGVATGIQEDETYTLTIPPTDAGMEMIVDTMESQVLAALFGTVTSPWRELLNRLVTRVDRIASTRGGSGEESRRWAARQLVFHMETLADNPPGTTMIDNHPIREFIALAAQASGTSSLSKFGDIVEQTLGNAELPDWQQVQAWMGLTKKGVLGIGYPTEIVLDALSIDDSEIPEDAPQIYMPNSPQDAQLPLPPEMPDEPATP